MAFPHTLESLIRNGYAHPRERLTVVTTAKLAASARQAPAPLAGPARSPARSRGAGARTACQPPRSWPRPSGPSLYPNVPYKSPVNMPYATLEWWTQVFTTVNVVLRTAHVRDPTLWPPAPPAHLRTRTRSVRRGDVKCKTGKEENSSVHHSNPHPSLSQKALNATH